VTCRAAILKKDRRFFISGAFPMKISVVFLCETGLSRRRRENVKKRGQASSSFDFALKTVIITIGEKVVSV